MLKYQFFPLDLRFNAIPINPPASYYVANDKPILQFVWKVKRPRIANMILKEKSKVRGLMLPYFKSYYKATIINSVWNWQKKKQTDHWHSIERLEKQIHIKRENYFLTQEQRQYHGAKTVFLTNGAETTRYPLAKKEKKEPRYIPHTLYKANLKWIIDLNVKCKTIKCREDNIEN